MNTAEILRTTEETKETDEGNTDMLSIFELKF
jgi:hypothetical protein